MKMLGLRDHIFKENTILYPAAFRAIRDPKVWDDILHKCDEIGYCCFTPAYALGGRGRGRVDGPDRNRSGGSDRPSQPNRRADLGCGHGGNQH